MRKLLNFFRHPGFKVRYRLSLILPSALLLIAILTVVIPTNWRYPEIAQILRSSTTSFSINSYASPSLESLRTNRANTAGNLTSPVNQDAPVITVAAVDSPSKESADFICDGKNDQVKIQDALDILNTSGGGKLAFLSGTYHLYPDDSGNICLSLPGNITLEGRGANREDVRMVSDGEPKKAIFQTSGYSYQPPWQGTTNITIRNLTIEAGNNSGSPRPWYAGFTGNEFRVLEANVDGLNMDNVGFIHTATQSVAQIYLHHCDNVTITNSLFNGVIIYSSANGVDSGQKNILLNQGKFIFQNNQVINFPRIGLYVDMNNLLVKGNTFHEGSYTAVDIGQSSHADIDGNRFSNISHQAIYSEGGHDINIHNNQIENINTYNMQTDGWSIHLCDLRSLRAGSQIFIENNVCQNCAQGIMSEGVQNVVIRNNTLSSIGGEAISLAALKSGDDGKPSFADGCQVYDNVIK